MTHMKQTVAKNLDMPTVLCFMSTVSTHSTKMPPTPCKEPSPGLKLRTLFLFCSKKLCPPLRFAYCADARRRRRRGARRKKGEGRRAFRLYQSRFGPGPVGPPVGLGSRKEANSVGRPCLEHLTVPPRRGPCDSGQP